MAVVTGSRAEFGLLAPVMRAIRDEPQHAAPTPMRTAETLDRFSRAPDTRLELLTVVAGSHLVGPAETWRDVAAEFEIRARVPMQREGETGRPADAAALGRGVEGYASVFAALRPDWVVVLGDRIEAFGAASAASVGGIAVAHIHGGDVAEGVSDDAMRHAITKLAHLHLCASEQSAMRVLRLGEDERRVRVVGSPALDGLDAIEPSDDETYARLGSPEFVFLMHPVGRSDAEEQAAAREALRALRGARTLALAPNLDPGRGGIVRAIEESGVRAERHLPRSQFVGLLKRVSREGGLLVGNSSCALIECGALRPALRAVDIGRRQEGRERSTSVVRAAGETEQEVRRAIEAARGLNAHKTHCPFGDGRAGARVAWELRGADPHSPAMLRKRNAY